MLDSFIVLISTAAILLGSPGPAPLALVATGAAFGIKKGTPFLAGILIGLSVVIIAASMGLATIFTQYPNVKIVCKSIGAAYILYIAYKIASAPIIVTKKTQSLPSFKDGFILNLFNVKAYAAFLALFSQFLLPLSNPSISYLTTAVTCLAVATIVDMLWLILGSLIRPIFSKPRHARVIRVLFSILMVIAVAYTLI